MTEALEGYCYSLGTVSITDNNIFVENLTEISTNITVIIKDILREEIERAFDEKCTILRNSDGIPSIF